MLARAFSAAFDFFTHEDTVFCLALLGFFIFVREAWSLLGVIYASLLRPGRNLRHSFGEWAVVTGATDGIGKAFAMEFARRGLSVLLISRSEDKLKETQGQIEAAHPKVKVKYEVIDFSEFGQEEYDQVERAIAKLDVGVLVNNVGISYPFPQWFHELTDHEVTGLLNINVNSLTWMTRAVLPAMLAKKRGAIVNMSSASARAPLPLLAAYSASKGYVENLTRSLALEYEGKGISFQCQSPLFVATSMTFPGSKVAVEKRSTLSTPTAAKYAKYAVSRIGYDTMVSPYWVHEFFLWVQSHLSDYLVGYGAFQMHLGLRFHKKNIAKMEEKTKGKKKTK
jgi:17beta-estradiol 17-dehydrogenase / very-long-chain 3-oxoacyl-CoA reductase